MRAITRLRVALAGLALLLVAGVVSQAGGSERETDSTSSSTKAMIGLVPWQEDQLLGERGSDYRYVIVRDVLPSTRQRLAALVEQNPKTRVLLYTDAAFMVHDRTDPRACDYWPFNGDGADFCTATKRHEGWFLHRGPARPGEPAKARRLISSSYPSIWAADIGDPGYRRRWIKNTLRRLRGERPGGTRVRVAGVYMDDINMVPGHGMDGRISEYTDDAYRAAAVGFAAQTARTLARHGFMTMANVGLDVHDPAQRAGLLEVAAAGVTIHREYFVRYGTGSPAFASPPADRGNDWLTELELFEQVQATGAGYVGLVYGGSARRGAEYEIAHYARATFLLGWDGHSPSALAFRTTDESNPKEFGSWQTEIGTPIEPRTQVGDRQAYTRRYTGGIAVVNADPTQSQFFFLDRGYRTRSGLCLSAIELPPASGAAMPSCVI